MGVNSVPKELFTLAEKIKTLREQNELTQSDLAKKMGLTRSAVNGWEMGLSVPSTPFIVELSKLFNVSTDYLLGMKSGATLNIDGLSEREAAVLSDLVRCFNAARE